MRIDAADGEARPPGDVARQLVLTAVRRHRSRATEAPKASAGRATGKRRRKDGNAPQPSEEEAWAAIKAFSRDQGASLLVLPLIELLASSDAAERGRAMGLIDRLFERSAEFRGQLLEARTFRVVVARMRKHDPIGARNTFEKWTTKFPDTAALKVAMVSTQRTAAALVTPSHGMLESYSREQGIETARNIVRAYHQFRGQLPEEAHEVMDDWTQVLMDAQAKVTALESLFSLQSHPVFNNAGSSPGAALANVEWESDEDDLEEQKVEGGLENAAAAALEFFPDDHVVLVSVPETDEAIEDSVRDIRLELEKTILPRLVKMIELINSWPEAPVDVKQGLSGVKSHVDRILELHLSVVSAQTMFDSC